jgi:hypothetical protein
MADKNALKVGECDSYTFAVIALRDQQFDIVVVRKMGVFEVVLARDALKDKLMQDGLSLTAHTGGYTTLVWKGPRSELYKKLTHHFGDLKKAKIEG